MLRLIGYLLLGSGVFGVVGELKGLELPTVRWPFTMSRDLGPLRLADAPDGDLGAPWFGWAWTVMIILVGLYIVVKTWRGVHFTPITQRRIQRFREIKRGYYSLVAILILAAIAALDHVVVGSEALAVKYD